MTSDARIIIGTGIALVPIMLAITWRVGSCIDRVEECLASLAHADGELRAGLAKLEGFLEGCTPRSGERCFGTHMRGAS